VCPIIINTGVGFEIIRKKRREFEAGGDRSVDGCLLNAYRKKAHTHASFIKINSWWHFNSYLCLLLRLFSISLGEKEE
jgi:hypothetical protein